MKAYLANGLFSIGDRLVNELIAKEIRKAIPEIDLYVPQENDAINDKQAFANSLAIAEADMAKLQNSDVLIAVLDGIEIDSGVAAEIGVFSTYNRPVIALFSDVRQLGRDNHEKINALIKDGTENQFIYRNLFVIGIIKRNGVIVSTVEAVVENVKRYLGEEKQ
ncbi:nucleoside 2-deoxyribosyltransferase [Lysinibacillus sp. SGAir0095]|uniref:nucleoside 2-deoxyribosyltransferase n=1 Tax=Lysinibacillus sp. SGAir0095 TaxID=2070463 RepID=UPI0010CD3990|nr:nucleoside 2-deoxyribosyltransferase [Lysinibacillus sp. SGAir0095]QCR32776.1 nucleoside 2-deoxyribosyltransferase [Lysinibacillus sp. SGAir0095]